MSYFPPEPDLDFAGELLKAIAIAWHDLGATDPLERSIACSMTREYLGEVMAWAVTVSQPEHWPAEAHALIADPEASDEEIAEAEMREAVSAYLRG